MRILHVAPIGDQRWVVTLDDDAQPPVSEHATRGEAETAARAYAEQFGYPEIRVHHANGEESTMLLDVAPQPPYPGGATGETTA